MCVCVCVCVCVRVFFYVCNISYNISLDMYSHISTQSTTGIKFHLYLESLRAKATVQLHSLSRKPLVVIHLTLEIKGEGHSWILELKVYVNRASHNRRLAHFI